MPPRPNLPTPSVSANVHPLQAILGLLLLVAAMASPGLMAQSLLVRPTAQLSNAGAPVTIEVEYTPGPQPISGFSFALSHTPGSLTLVSVGAGGASTSAGTSVSGSLSSPGNISVTGLGTSTIPQGVIAVIACTAVGTGNPFPNVPLGLLSPSLSLVGGGSVTPAVTAGSVTFTDRRDVDRSAGIDVVDIQYVVNLILALRTPDFPNHGDCNGDASVDVVDVQLLVNAILNPNQPLSVTTQSVPGATVGVPYAHTFFAGGGVQPYAWSEVSAGIPGLSLSSGGVLSGTATMLGQYGYTVRVTDANNATADATFAVSVSQVVLQSIAIAPSPVVLDHNATLQLTATGTYSDNSTANVTSQVNWTSNAPSVAGVGFTTGLVTGLAPGTASVSCVHPGVPGVTAQVDVTVSKVLASLAVSPAAGSVVRLLTQAYTATATFSDNSTQNVTAQATWASSATSVASISAAGVATGLTAGSTSISACFTFGGVTKSDSKPLTVTQEVLATISVAPNPASGTVGGTVAFTASGTFNNGTQSANVGSLVTWSSSSVATATVNASGVASLLAAGTTNITATRVGGGVSGSAQLTVTGPALVSYSAQIAPLWQSFGCLTCHPTEGGYSMTTYAGVVGNGAHGPAVVPSNAANSHLYQILAANQSFGPRMPENGPYLSAAQLQLVADWINQGALNN